MKRFISIMLVLMMVLSIGALAGCSKTETATPTPAAGTTAPTTPATGEPTATGEKKVLRVGMECAYAPFNWTQLDDSNGAVPIEGGDYAGGYDVEIAKFIAAELGYDLVIVKTIWDGLAPALQSGTIDLIIAGMSPRADRKETIDFSDYYYQSELVIVVKAGGKYENATSLADFAGAKITAQLNTLHYDVIDQIEGVDKQEAMDDFTAMRVALESGIIDGYVSEKPEGVSASAANSAFKMVTFADGSGFTTTEDEVAISVGIKKGSGEMLAAINAALAKISADQRIQMMMTATENQPAS